MPEVEPDYEKMRRRPRWRSRVEVVAILGVASYITFAVASGDPRELDALFSSKAIEWGSERVGEEILKDSIAREERLRTGELPVARALDVLASFYTDNERHSDAEPLRQRALAIRKRVLDGSDPDLAQSYHDLAINYRDQGWQAAAEPLFRQSLEIREKTLGRDHPQIAESLVELAMIENQAGSYDEAGIKLQRALEIMQGQAGAIQRPVSQILNQLASVRKSQGRLDEAAQLLEDAVEALQGSVAPRFPKTARLLDAIDSIDRPFGGIEMPERLLKSSIGRAKQYVQPAHRDMATLYNNIGMLAMKRRKFAEAEVGFTRAVEINRVLPPDEMLPRVLFNLANLYSILGGHDKARALYEEALAESEDLLPDSDPVRLAIVRKLENAS